MATRLDRLGARRIDPTSPTVLAKALRENWRTINQSDSVKYVVGAMEPIDPGYTQNTFKEGERVRNQLEKNLNQACEYEYQGSTTNDTHIKAASDIDLLVITSKFWSLEPPQVANPPYQGDPIKDMHELRGEAAKVLKTAFPQVTVDTTGAKSIVLTGGSLTRKVDVVPANWWDTVKYANTKLKLYRGVHIFDSKANQRLPNTPFLHNALIEARDNNTKGGMRKAARLMKSLKYDSEAIDLSSYDIVSIAYNIPEAMLTVSRDQPLMILEACYGYVTYLQINQPARDAIKVPDDHRTVFAPGHATVTGLNQLAGELQKLTNDVLTENTRSFKRLAEARIPY